MRYNLKSSPPSDLYLGRQGENGVKILEFDVSPLVSEFGVGSLTLAYKRTDTESPYPVVLDIVDGVAYWNVSNTDTDIAGNGEAQFTYTVNGRIKKTVIYKTKVLPSLLPTSGDAPDPFDNWLDQLGEIGGQIVVNKNQALSEIANSKADALNNIQASLESAISAIDTDGTAYVDSIETSGSSYVQQIQTDGTDALTDISAARANALTDISSARAGALTDIGSARTAALGDIQTAETDALSIMTQKVTQAEEYAESAENSAELAEQYRDEAQSYAENLHFIDSDGDIIISIGG